MVCYDVTSGVGQGQVAEKAVDPKQNTTVKVYDQNGRLSGVKDSETAVAASYEYYPNGAQKKVTNPDGSSANFAYYDDGMLSSLTNKSSSGTVIDNYAYTYDAARNQTSKTETVNGIDKGTTAYTYDSVNRLKKVTEPSSRVTEYGYDKAGNRKTETVTENGVTSQTTYTYNEQGRLINTVQNVDNTTKTVTYNYDNNGNVYSKTQGVTKPDTGELSELALSLLGLDSDPAFGAVYEYNVFNQLVKTYQGDKTITNVYNAEGLRVSKTVNGNTCNYLYESDKIVLETDGNGNETARNIYGLSLISRKTGGKTFNYHYNAHGDVTSLTGTNGGTVVARYDYDAFGNHLDGVGDKEINNPFRYSGYEFDEETDLYYLKSRFYSAETARFMQEDTYRGNPNDPLSLNLYTYVNNNPMTYTDWLGFFGTADYDPNNPFLMLYTSDKPERYNDEANYYVNGVQYSLADIAELIKLANGNVNVVLSVRELDFAMNSEEVVAKLTDTYSQIIQYAIDAAGEDGVVPQFFLGTPHYDTSQISVDNDVFASMYASVTKEIVNNVKEKIANANGLSIADVGMIGGLYFGREDPNNLYNDTVNNKGDLMYQTMLGISQTAHENGGSVVWIPFITNQEEYYNVGLVANHATYNDENGRLQNLMDVVILQPGYFYPEIGAYQSEEYFAQKMQDIYDSVLYQKVIMNGEEVGGKSIYSTTRIGVEFEADLGMLTGRALSKEGGYSSRDSNAETKIRNFSVYISKYYDLVQGKVDGNRKPYAIYAGGPNELNLSNPSSPNTRIHGKNHPTYYANWGTEYAGNGIAYNQFSAYGGPLYGGNLMYDVLNGLINNDWSSSLLNFIYDNGKISELLPISPGNAIRR